MERRKTPNGTIYDTRILEGFPVAFCAGGGVGDADLSPAVDAKLINTVADGLLVRSGLFYVRSIDAADVYYKRDEEYVEGEQYTGGGGENAGPIENYHSAIRAIDPVTGDVRWEYPIAPRSTSGLLTTAGDLVFGGTVDGYFFAIDAVSGQELWHVAVGARVHSAPLTYSVNGEQFVTIAAGNVVFTFGLNE